MADTEPLIETLSHARSRCTVTIHDRERGRLEEESLERIGHTWTMKGFRKGKIPRAILRKNVPPDQLTKEVIESFLRTFLPEFLSVQKISPIIPPQVELLQKSPLTLRITLLQKPTVKLRNLTDLRIDRQEVDVSDEDIDHTIQTMKGERNMPETTDAPELRSRIRAALQKHREHKERQRRERLLLEHLRNATDIDLAPELIHYEAERLLTHLHQEHQRNNDTWESWLKRTGKTTEIVIKELRQEAEAGLRLHFSIDALVEKESAKTEKTQGPDQWQRRVQALFDKFLER